jgi:hypothetical protein
VLKIYLINYLAWDKTDPDDKPRTRYYRPSELTRIKGSLIHKALLKYKHNKFSVYILETYESDKLISRK